jgi:hypothetical protein
MPVIRGQEYTFVTNNLVDFIGIYGKEPLHAGVIILVPSVAPARQRQLFTAALKHIGTRDLTNTVVEAQFSGDTIKCSKYVLPSH